MSLNNISIFISGAITTWIIKILLDRTLKSEVTKIINSIISGLIFKKSLQTSHQEYFKIGAYTTSLFVLDGDGDSSYTQNSINAFFHDGSPDSPDDIADRILLAEREMEEARELGNSHVWDGIGVGIRKFTVLRTPEDEKLGLEIHFYKSRYAAFRATVVEIGQEDRRDPNSIYRKYLEGRDPSDIVDFLARHVGVAAIVITKDGHILMAKRSKSTGVRQDEYDVSVVEGIEPTKDVDLSGPANMINIIQAIRRGCGEELGFLPSFDEIKLLGFAVEMKFYQFNFLSIIRTNLTVSQIKEQRSGRAKDAWESRIHTISFAVDEVLEFINSHKMWGFAIILLYWALRQDYARTNIAARAAQIITNSKNT